MNEEKNPLVEAIDFAKFFNKKKLELILNKEKMTLLNSIMMRSLESGMTITLLREFLFELIDEL